MYKPISRKKNNFVRIKRRKIFKILLLQKFCAILRYVARISGIAAVNPIEIVLLTHTSARI